MSAADFADLDDDVDDTGRVPRTPTETEVPAIVREHSRAILLHAKHLRAYRRVLWGVVIAVLVGSLGVIGTVAAFGFGLGARMERIESLAWRVERLERAEERRP